MKMTYDYQELIDEIKDEIGDGILTKKAVIQILRDEKAMKDGYFPIIDWYYNKEMMIEDLAPEESDTKEDKKEKLLIREQYQKDQSQLKNIVVEECLTEMYDRTNG